MKKGKQDLVKCVLHIGCFLLPQRYMYVLPQASNIQHVTSLVRFSCGWEGHEYTCEHVMPLSMDQRTCSIHQICSA